MYKEISIHDTVYKYFSVHVKLVDTFINLKLFVRSSNWPMAKEYFALLERTLVFYSFPSIANAALCNLYP